jgi:hypothetical protein
MVEGQLRQKKISKTPISTNSDMVACTCVPSYWEALGRGIMIWSQASAKNMRPYTKIN